MIAVKERSLGEEEYPWEEEPQRSQLTEAVRELTIMFSNLTAAGSNVGYGLPSLANDTTSNQYFKVFCNLFLFFNNYPANYGTSPHYMRE